MIVRSLQIIMRLPTLRLSLWSSKANGRDPKSRLGQDFNFKLGVLQNVYNSWPMQTRLSLDLKTQPRFCPVSLSLSMLSPILRNARPIDIQSQCQFLTIPLLKV
jgi:hypothetical protein